MGFAQGYLLLPLVAFGGYQRYKMEFLLPKMAEQIEMKTHWKSYCSLTLLLFACLALLIGLTHFFVFSETIYVIGLISATSLVAYLKINQRL
jgi:hypothetical protein